MKLIVTGTPGTGKTTLAKEFAIKFDLEYIEINEFVQKFGLSLGFDKQRDCEIIDEEKLMFELEKYIKEKKDFVIDSHLSHFIDPVFVDKCIVTKCDLKILKKRLEKRGYSERKIRENLDAEIFDTCRVEALENGHKIEVVKMDIREDLEGYLRINKYN